MRNNWGGNDLEQIKVNLDSGTENQTLEILRSFRKVKHSLYYLLRKDADALGSTFMQFQVLRSLRDHPDIGLTELADLILIGNSTTSGVVDRLVKSGLVLRKRLESDRRSVTISLTAKGDELQEQMEHAYMERLAPLNQLSDKDINELLRIHQQIDEILHQGREKVNYE
jgi:DNA-binding MarR family transcriptional regulator